MSCSKRFELSQPPSPSLFYGESAIWTTRFPSYFELDEQIGFDIESLNPTTFPFDLLLPPVGLFGSASIGLRRLQERAETELFIQSLSDRVTALELGFDRAQRSKIGDRKYKWTAEIKGAKEEELDKKYSWTTVLKSGGERDFKWKADIKGKGKNQPASRTYTFQASTAPAKDKDEHAEKNGKKETKKGARVVEKKGARVVEIEEEPNRGGIAIRKAFAKSAVNRNKGKVKELSPQDAAMVIQITFRAYLVRRAQVLRGLRDLAVAKAKLKEIRALFSNFSYRRRITTDAEECQRFSEKIIVLLLTVDAIEGPDPMVRAVKKSMIDELEAMLEVVDPQPSGKLGSMKRRRFSLPDGGPISKELSAGVTQVVELLEQEDHRSNA